MNQIIDSGVLVHIDLEDGLVLLERKMDVGKIQFHGSVEMEGFGGNMFGHIFVVAGRNIDGGRWTTLVFYELTVP